MELYSLKFEIDFGVITDRGVFIEEILAEVHKSQLSPPQLEFNGSNNHLVSEDQDGVWDLMGYETIRSLHEPERTMIPSSTKHLPIPYDNPSSLSGDFFNFVIEWTKILSWKKYF